MSSALGIASVSFVLVDLLNNGLIDQDISATGVGDVNVTALPPDRAEAANAGQSQLNIFLYQVTENAALRNNNMPSRNARGERIDNPPLALDLHYLLTAYGGQQLHAEILLGYAMQLLHETPVLTRDAIRRSLAAPSQVIGGSGVPAAMLNLYTSGLAEQPEQIKIAPQTLSTEEISRLWTAFQAKYRPTAAYLASVVLIQSRASTKSALPVMSRLIKAIPLQRPVIEEVLSQSAVGAPIVAGQPILPGYRLVLRGSQLKGEETLVDVAGVEAIPADADITGIQIVVPLPAGVPAGTQSLQVVHRVDLGSPPAEHRGVESNQAAFVLRPVVQSVSAVGASGKGDLNLTVVPAVGPRQRAVVLLNGASSYSFLVPPRTDLASPPPGEPAPTTTLTVPFAKVQPGSYLLRLQVDGAESPLEVNGSGQFVGPKVTIA
ncbi:MAG TPA: DUF4255 domain-containing protein [Bryobacteraceae bacterium]|nr:DUF4255 domain-containing protein [Bryobacteraceae bacterium]